MPVTRRVFLSSFAGATLSGQSPSFSWPKGKRMAISLSFDDARVSQPDVGIPFLNKMGAKATFYLNPGSASQRASAWKEAHAAGHEIAHHSNTHPCTGNYAFSKGNALEDYTLERMAADLDTASAEIERLTGAIPVSFAYPCGLKFVGRGESTQSYVPLIAKRFESGRGYLDEAANDPRLCDFAQLMGTAFDAMTWAQMKVLIDTAAKDNRWVIFAGHSMGKSAFQVTDLTALELLIRHAEEPNNGVWLDTVANIMRHVKKVRGGGVG